MTSYLTSVVVLGLGPWPWDVLEDKFWVLGLGLGLEGQVIGFGLGLEQKSLALAKQVLGLAGLVICQTNNTATMLKSTFIAWMTLLCSTNLWIKCLLHELVPPLSYFFLVLCSLAPCNLKRSLNVFWCQVLGLGLEAQVLVNNTTLYLTSSKCRLQTTTDILQKLFKRKKHDTASQLLKE